MLQCVRAATLLHGALAYHQRVCDGDVPTEVARGLPQCMAQYRRLFAQSRLPDMPVDRLTTGAGTGEAVRHVVVMRGGHMFKVTARTADLRRPLPAAALCEQLQAVCKAAADLGDSAAVPIGLLTAGSRENWAEARALLLQQVRAGVGAAMLR